MKHPTCPDYDWPKFTERMEIITVSPFDNSKEGKKIGTAAGTHLENCKPCDDWVMERTFDGDESAWFVLVRDAHKTNPLKLDEASLRSEMELTLGEYPEEMREIMIQDRIEIEQKVVDALNKSDQVLVDCRSGTPVEIGEKRALATDLMNPPLLESGEPNLEAPPEEWISTPVEHWFIVHQLLEEGEPLPDGIEPTPPMPPVGERGRWEGIRMQRCVIEFYSNMRGEHHSKREWLLPAHPGPGGREVLMVTDAL